MIVKVNHVLAGLETSIANSGFNFGVCPPLFAGVSNLGRTPFSLRQPHTARTGSVIREQRQANATTRTTGCSLYELAVLGLWVASRYNPFGGAVQNSCEMIESKYARPIHSENIRWSSSPSPVNRLQATGEPRRVMLGGSKSYMLGSEGTGQTRPASRRESVRFHQRNSLKQLLNLNHSLTHSLTRSLHAQP